VEGLGGPGGGAVEVVGFCAEGGKWDDEEWEEGC
jgi:hypothetical protein